MRNRLESKSNVLLFYQVMYKNYSDTYFYAVDIYGTPRKLCGILL